MINLNEIQKDLAKWQSTNFGIDDRTRICLALGVCEEVGELAHAILKGEQGIRGYGDDKIVEEVVDAIFDTWIYTIQILSILGIDAEQGLEKTANEVLQRDWLKYPVNGKDK